MTIQNSVNERIDALRSEMEREQIDWYIIPMGDFHSSEYVGEHFKCVQFISGFTGSSATVLISKDDARLWTDGRYFIQAERELAGSYVSMEKLETVDGTEIEDFLKEHIPPRGVIGFDGRCLDAETAEKYAEVAYGVDGAVRCFAADESGAAERADDDGLLSGSGNAGAPLDLVGRIWDDRPPLPAEPVWILEDKYAGESVAEKLKWLRDVLHEKCADAFLCTSLYDIAWLMNLRGNDIAHVPVFMAYLYLTRQAAMLYVQESALSDKVRDYLSKNGITVRPYDAIYAENFAGIEAVLLDHKTVNFALTEALPKNVRQLREANPTELRKATKNPTEIQNTIEAHIKDGVAVTKFIYWLKQNIGKTEITELSASDYLYERREEQEHFLDLSFDTICAYGANAAMMHYEATPESFAKLEPHGFLLVDSGGHYLEGTTDITRTIVLGELTEKEKLYFTVALRSHLRLAAAKFHKGCIGQNLDILARGPVWDMGLDYRCGTGHGVGHILNVHEGPQNFRWKVADESKVWELLPGMITSDEPGLYVENECGIRHESELLIVEDEETEYGQFYSFQNITYAPIDLAAVDETLLTQYEKQTLNDYHKMVYETLAPHLSDEERAWLKQETRAI